MSASCSSGNYSVEVAGEWQKGNIFATDWVCPASLFPGQNSPRGGFFRHPRDGGGLLAKISKNVRIARRAEPVGLLCDVTVDRPRILFVGINPSLASGRVGHHFAGPGNPFWRLLHAAKIVPEPLTYEQDARLAEFGLALTNLCSRATRSASDLTREEMEQGKRLLAEKVERLKPEVVAFVGLTLYQRYFDHPRSGGPGPKDERISGARVFVVPNPSGLNAAFPGFRHKLAWYERLREFSEGERT
jgi:double-stranded uracil-DNA glycosylase